MSFLSALGLEGSSSVAASFWALYSMYFSVYERSDVHLRKGFRVGLKSGAAALVNPETESFQMLHSNEWHGDSSSASFVAGGFLATSQAIESKSASVASKEQLFGSCKSLLHQVTGSCGIESAEDEGSFHGVVLVKACLGLSRVQFEHQASNFAIFQWKFCSVRLTCLLNHLGVVLVPHPKRYSCG